MEVYCFTDDRDPEASEHSVLDLVRQRIFYGLCLGYEDLNDHDRLRTDALIAACVGKQDPEGQPRRRPDERGKPMAGKSTLNRLELSKVGADPDSPYCKIVADLDGLADLLVDLFLDAHDSPPEEITLDIDPTNLETFGQQLARHFQKHYDGYCYLPQYVFCGEFLLAAQLRPGDVGAMSGAMSGAMKLLPKIVTRIRQRWPDVRITIRGDGHFSDDRSMSWCEATPGLEFIVGMPSNARLMNEVQEAQRQMAAEFAAAKQSDENSGPPQESPRTFVEFVRGKPAVRGHASEPNPSVPMFVRIRLVHAASSFRAGGNGAFASSMPDDPHASVQGWRPDPGHYPPRVDAYFAQLPIPRVVRPSVVEPPPRRREVFPRRLAFEDLALSPLVFSMYWASKLAQCFGSL